MYTCHIIQHCFCWKNVFPATQVIKYFRIDVTSVVHTEVSQQHKLTSMINKGAVKKAFIKSDYCPTILCNSQVVKKYLLDGWYIHSEMPLKSLLLYNYISWWHVLPVVVAAIAEALSRMFFKLSFDWNSPIVKTKQVTLAELVCLTHRDQQAA